MAPNEELYREHSAEQPRAIEPLALAITVRNGSAHGRIKDRSHQARTGRH